MRLMALFAFQGTSRCRCCTQRTQYEIASQLARTLVGEQIHGSFKSPHTVFSMSGTPRQMRGVSTNYGLVVGLTARPCIGSAYLSAFSAAVGGYTICTRPRKTSCRLNRAPTPPFIAGNGLVALGLRFVLLSSTLLRLPRVRTKELSAL